MYKIQNSTTHFTCMEKDSSRSRCLSYIIFAISCPNQCIAAIISDTRLLRLV